MEFQSDEEFETWLKDQPQEVCVAIATRAALRVWPLVFFEWSYRAGSRHDQVLEMVSATTGWALLSATIAVHEPSRQNKEIANHAGQSATNVFASIGASEDVRGVARAIGEGQRAPVFMAINSIAAAAAAAREETIFSLNTASSTRFADFAEQKARNIAKSVTSNRMEAYADSHLTPEEMFRTPLWRGEAASAQVLRNKKLVEYFHSKVPFFAHWFESLLDGDSDAAGHILPFSLVRRIVTEIPRKTWEAGVYAVAPEIARIEAEWLAQQAGKRSDSVPELEREKLVQHVRKLLQAPKVTALCAEGSAETIEKAIKEYTDQTGANCLPMELEALDDLPPLFRRIAVIAKSSDAAEVKVEAMTAQIEALNASIAQLEADLQAARAKTLHGVFRKSAAESLGKTVGSPWFIGAMSLGAAHFFGWTPEDWNFENLRGWAEDLLQATPAPADPLQLPPATEA